MKLGRRAVLAGAAGAVIGCRGTESSVAGGFVGASHERGHLLRQAQLPSSPAVMRRTQVLIAGGGIAGLAAARALRLRGIEDFALLELEDQPGGNSRAGQVQGMACPLGAHYLPVPGDHAREVQDLLEELGLRRREAGRWTYDERHLVHFPQERLYFGGQWQEGLLPLHGISEATLSQYRRFAERVQSLRRQAPFTLPVQSRTSPAHAALDRVTFSQWLGEQGLNDPHLRWYLDYCCRDEYGASLEVVSAWAGIHYFAARHGFHPPGFEAGERDALLTWPEGNGWLAQALARPLGDRLQSGRVVLRIEALRHGVQVDAFDVHTQRVERWQAERCIVALPLFVAARVLVNPPQLLRARAARTRYATWLVANLHLSAPLAPRPGLSMAWDNVVYGAASLGYVDASHQKLDPTPGPTVLTWYCAPGEVARAQLLQRPWQAWKDEILNELTPMHPDLPEKLTRIDIARYGHAMAIPVPGTRLNAGLTPRTDRIAFAHSDWAGYSVFEEAFTLGHRAARAI